LLQIIELPSGKYNITNIKSKIVETNILKSSIMGNNANTQIFLIPKIILLL
jgi:hypothetical protein